MWRVFGRLGGIGGESIGRLGGIGGESIGRLGGIRCTGHKSWDRKTTYLNQKQINDFVFQRLTNLSVSFCTFTKRITPKIRSLCFYPKK